MKLLQLGLILLLVYMTLLILFGADFLFIDSFNLVMHEGGHLVFGLFGTTIMFLGGTVFQVLIPTICAGVLLRQQKDWFGAIACLWWIGENLINIARYIKDAQYQLLPLIGGEHDWAYLFGIWGVLDYSNVIGQIVRVLGLLTMFISIGYLVYLFFWTQNREKASPQLSPTPFER